MADQSVFDLDSTYLALATDGGIATMTVTDDFWATVDQRRELAGGRLVMLARYEADWPSWEVHPAGDELVYLLAGAVDLVLDEPGGERVVELRGRAGCLVPAGVWHTARVHDRATPCTSPPATGPTTAPWNGPGPADGHGVCAGRTRPSVSMRALGSLAQDDPCEHGGDGEGHPGRCEGEGVPLGGGRRGDEALRGMGSLTAATVAAGQDGPTAASVVVPALLGVALLGAFARVEAVVGHPLVPLGMLTTRRRAVGLLTAMLPPAAGTASVFLLSFNFQDVLGWSALRTAAGFTAHIVAPR
jgi:mannose-6-phosphate isomerase-like protein (cupin superfamily)